MDKNNIYFDTKRRRAQQAIISNINVTPLVDVMLVLLIIFMITSPMLSSAINIDLPEAKVSKGVHEDEPLIISIDKNSNIYILDTKINSNDLAKKLRAITKENLDTRIFLRGDKNLAYSEVIKVFAEITRSGFTKVALIINNIIDEQK